MDVHTSTVTTVPGPSQPPSRGLDPEWAVERQIVAAPAAQEDSFPGGTLLLAGDMSAWWSETLATGSYRLRGLLREDHHGQAPLALAATVGEVLTVQVVSHVLGLEERRDGTTWVPMPGRKSLRAVDKGPKWFGSPLIAGARVGAERLVESGVLVHLDVADAEDRPGRDPAISRGR